MTNNSIKWRKIETGDYPKDGTIFTIHDSELGVSLEAYCPPKSPSHFGLIYARNKFPNFKPTHYSLDAIG